VEHRGEAFHVERRLESLSERYGLAAESVAALRALLAWQAEDEHASTTVRDPAVAVDRHVADSLVALELDAVRAAGSIADLGAGAGWPGLALAACLPAARVSLVESASRRCRYLARAVEAAGLEARVEVVHARAESWTPGSGVDVVTARALAPLNVLCEYAAPLLREGGVLVAWKGRVADDELEAGRRAAELVGLGDVEVREVDPYPGAGPATLVVVCKIAPTPERFPRRPGMALKRPLGV
jgi:16S rRNA (guanine527-N7)-methyltransferase